MFWDIAVISRLQKENMFGFGKPRFLGVDFGTSYIKAVELEWGDNTLTLSNYGYIEMSPTEGRESALSVGTSEQMVQEHLAALFSKMNPIAKNVNLALPGSSGLIKLIELPMMNQRELEQAIPFEAHKYIPSPLDEVAFSWEVVSGMEQKPDSQKKVEVLLVAALRKEVAKFEQYVSKSGLSVGLLELEVFPLVRAVVRDAPGLVLLIDIGSKATNLIVIREGIVYLNRTLNAGGNEITNVLSESFRISWERAEELKCSSKDFLNQPEAALSFPSLDLVSSEASRLISTLSGKGKEMSVNKIILSGGSSRMTGLPQFFSKLFGLPVALSDPWQGIHMDEALRPTLERLGPAFSIATGLALGGIDRYRKK